jgi:hypothetical protein
MAEGTGGGDSLNRPKAVRASGVSAVEGLGVQIRRSRVSGDFRTSATMLRKVTGDPSGVGIEGRGTGVRSGCWCWTGVCLRFGLCF